MREDLLIMVADNSLLCQHAVCIYRFKLGIITIAIVVERVEVSGKREISIMYNSRSLSALLSVVLLLLFENVASFYHFTAPCY